MSPTGTFPSTVAPRRDVGVRALLDLAIVHASLLAVWLAATLLEIASADLASAQSVLAGFGAHYLFFCPVSLLFPLGFAIAGVYDPDAPSGVTRAVRAARATALVGLLFLFINYGLGFKAAPGWSIAIAFTALVNVLVPGTRLIKALFVSRYKVALRRSPARVRPSDTILVVGGAGYIGSMLVHRLLAQGYRVRVLDKLVYGSGALHDVLGNKRLELIEGDCRNIKHVVQAVTGVGAIVHLAAIVGDLACDLNRLATLEINYAATRMLIEVAKGNGVRRFVFASSCSVYGATDELVDETAQVEPISLYGRTKAESEQALIAAADSTFEPTILRLATVFGHSYRPRFDLVVNLLTAKAFQEKLITIFNGQQWRPFIHVWDVAEAIMTVLASRQNLGGQIFNVGDSRMNSTLSNIAEKVQKFFPNARIEHIENSDRRNYRVSFAKIESVLGFRSHWALEPGILQMKRELEAGRIEDYRDPYYSNQKFLANVGPPAYAQESDATVMAAFANGMVAERRVQVAS